MLPYIPYGDRLRTQQQTGWGGINHNPSAADGELYAVQNLTSDLYPLLSSRPARESVTTLAKSNGLYAKEKLAWVDGTGLYYDNELVGQVADSAKTFASLGNFLLIFPDKKYFLTNWQEGNIYERFGSLEASYTSAAGAITFSDGLYAEKEAAANSITTTGAAFPFRKGDAVTISGCTQQPANNKTPVIQEISADNKTLRFYPNAFILPERSKSYREPGAITLARTVPELDYCCENENRLWGVKGKEIFACKLGDPFNWQVFSGLSTDSYNVATGTDGDFTAAVSYLGYPALMKPGAIHKIYGTKPSNFQAIHSANLGVAAGSERSPALVANTLYYLSDNGVVAYQGGIPTVISAPLGERFHNGIGGTDGEKYYLSMEDELNTRRLLVYDPRYDLWHEEDDPGISAMATLSSQLYFLAGNTIYQERGSSYQGVEWSAETADFYEDHYGQKAVGPYLVLRYQLAVGARLRIAISYNSGPWEELGTITGDGGKHSKRIAAIPARCDYYRLRLAGTGQMTLYSLARQAAAGSAV